MDCKRVEPFIVNELSEMIQLYFILKDYFRDGNKTNNSLYKKFLELQNRLELELIILD